MIGSHNATNDLTDSQGFSIQSYYDAVLSAISESDIFPNSYEDVYTAPVSGAMECGMEQLTVMSMPCDTLRFIDLNESDLHFTMRYKYTLNAPQQYLGEGGKKKYYTYYIGPKRSFDIIGHYLLQSNNDVPFLDVVDSHFESFIDYIATINDGTADETTATVEKIREMSPFVPGFYHTMTANSSPTNEYVKELKFRVPITDWHVMRDLRWFQNWMGELKFQLYPTVSKFCIMPVWSKADIDFLSQEGSITVDGGTGANADTDNYILSIAAGFNQTDTDFQLPDATNTTKNKFSPSRLSSLRTSVISDLELITRQSMLKPDVAAALQQNFIQTPLMFPVLNWDYMAFSSEMGTSDTANPAITIALQHCDTGFLLFRRNHNDLTTFINPEVEFRLQIGSKLVPQKSYRTYEDHRFTSLFYDGLNIKNNANFRLQNSVYNSIQPYTVSDEAGATELTRKYKYNCIDRTNFCIPVPFTSDEWFQGGISQPNSPLKLNILSRRKHGLATGGNDKENFIQPVFAYCQDHILRIYSAKPGLAKQIDISTRSVGQILATGQP